MSTVIDYIPTLAIAMLRPVGATLFIAIFSKAILGGGLVRNSIILMLAIPILPKLSVLSLPNPDTQIIDYLFIACEELIIGMVIGIIFAVPFWALDIAGFYIDTVRGSSIASVFNPQLGTTSSQFGIFMTQVISFVFVAYGGLTLYINALYGSYDIIMPGQPWHVSKHTLTYLFNAWNVMVTTGFQVAMPGIIMMVLTDVSLGFMNRAAPQINVFSLAFSIKSMVAFFVYIVCTSFFLDPVLNSMKIFHLDVIKSMLP